MPSLSLRSSSPMRAVEGDVVVVAAVAFTPVYAAGNATVVAAGLSSPARNGCVATWSSPAAGEGCVAVHSSPARDGHAAASLRPVRDGAGAVFVCAPREMVLTPSGLRPMLLSSRLRPARDGCIMTTSSPSRRGGVSSPARGLLPSPPPRLRPARRCRCCLEPRCKVVVEERIALAPKAPQGQLGTASHRVKWVKAYHDVLHGWFTTML